MGKRGIVWLMIIIFSLVLVSLSLAQSSNTGCFTRPNYVRTNGCADVARSNIQGASYCNNNATCEQIYFYNASCSNVAICQATSGGWCIDQCNSATYPAECQDRGSFVLGSKPAVCETGCCVCTNSTNNICRGDITANECMQYCGTLTNYYMAHLNTTMTSGECSNKCSGIAFGAAMISGTVREGQNGQPLGSAIVSLLGIQMTTAGDGSYGRQVFVTGQIPVFAYYTLTGRYGVNYSSAFLTSGQQTTVDFTLPLVNTARIYGKITDSNAQPINGATVYVTGQTYSQAVTNASGDYELVWLPFGNYTLTASKTSYTSATSALMTLNQTNSLRNVDLSLNLIQQAFIYGQVKELSTANPNISQAQIYLDNQYAGLTDTYGRFNLSVSANSTGVNYSLYIRKSDYQQSVTEYVFIRVNEQIQKNFNLISTRTSCSSPASIAVPSLTANHVAGTKAVRLSWTNSCSNVAGFYINRSTGLAALRTESSVIFLPVVDAQQIPLTYTDYDVNWSTNYTYKIWAFYNDVSNRLSAATTTNIITGEADCEGKYQNSRFIEFCDGYYYRRTCDNQNKKTSVTGDSNNPADCSTKTGNYRCWGPDLSGQTQCRDATCTGSNVMIPITRDQCNSNTRFCYYESTSSTTPACYSCNAITSCFDYRSQSSCTINNCLGRNCSWINSTTGAGWCVELNYNQTDHCQDCSGTAPAGKNLACTANICSALGRCFSITSGSNQWCSSCSGQSKCTDFTTQTTCEGGQPRLISSQGLITPSRDACGLGTCKYDSNNNQNVCFKDGDADGGDECLDTSKVATSDQTTCQQDNSPPVTRVSPSAYISVGGAQSQITFLATDSVGATLAYCVDTTNTCLPDFDLVNLTYQSGSVSVNLANSSVLKDAYTTSRGYYLRYRSRDKYYNVEAVQSRGIFADLSGPQIILNYQLNEKTTGSDLDFTIVTTERANCSDKLEQVGGSNRTGLSPTVISDNWRITYANLPDGLYNYEVACTDAVGNTAWANRTGIVIDAIKAVRVMMPNRTTSLYQFQFILETDTLGTCYLYEGTTSRGAMPNNTNTPQTHTSSASYTFTDGYYQNWRAECFIPTQDNVQIPFTVDHNAPVTRVDLTSRNITITVGGNFTTSLTGTTDIAFQCEDQPTNGFGCNETRWCLASLGSTCTPIKNTVRTTTTSKTLCYQSIDKNSNTEAVNCGDIRIRPGAGVKVIEPPRGASATITFNLTITTNLRTDLCKFSGGTFNFSRVTNANNYFTKIDDFTHQILDFTNNPEVARSNFPNSNPDSLDVYIICNLTNSEIAAQEMVTLTYDNTPPVINVGTDPASPIASGNSLDLVIDSDEEVICKYSQTATTYSDMQGQFPGYDSEMFKMQNRQAISIGPNGNYGYKVACENKAGLVSQVKQINYTIDTSLSGSITGTGPTGVTSAQSVTLTATTNKDATCSYGSPSVQFSTTGQLNHAATKSNLSEGGQAIRVDCYFPASFSWASNVINFKVDRTAPTITKVNDGVYSCSLVKASVLFEAYDNVSSATEFEYQLWKGTTNLLNGTTTSAQATITGLNLTKGETYFFKARAKDEAGNWGSTYVTSDGFEASLANRSECLDKGPPKLSLLRNVTSDGLRVTIACYDETGCAEVNYGTAETAADCLPVQTYQNIPVLLTSTSYICAEATDIVGNKGNISTRFFVGDEDSDKVGDAYDQCPGTNPGEIVDEKGCSEKQKATDTDHDRLPDWWEKRYDSASCQLNFRDEDSNNNGIADGLEDYNRDNLTNYDNYLGQDDPCQTTDADLDTVPDYLDRCDNTPASEIGAIIKDKNSSYYGCGPSETFSLGDEIDDGWRRQYFGCVECPEAAADFDYDEDGLTNVEEYRLKEAYGESTDPTEKDTDGDGYDDKTEVDNDWDPLDANNPPQAEGGGILPLILLILGMLLVLGGMVYLMILNYKKPGLGPRPAAPAMMPGPRPRPIMMPRVVIPGAYAEELAKRRAEREAARKERIESVFGVFGGKKQEPLPHLAKIVKQEDKSVFDRLTEATHHYITEGDEADKLSRGEKNVFEELAEKVEKPTKTEVRRVLNEKSKDEVHETFNKLVEMVGRHAGKKKEFDKLKKNEEEE